MRCLILAMLTIGAEADACKSWQSHEKMKTGVAGNACVNGYGRRRSSNSGNCNTICCENDNSTCAGAYIETAYICASGTEIHPTDYGKQCSGAVCTQAECCTTATTTVTTTTVTTTTTTAATTTTTVTTTTLTTTTVVVAYTCSNFPSAPASAPGVGSSSGAHQIFGGIAVTLGVIGLFTVKP